jgi:hypothetical protein
VDERGCAVASSLVALAIPIGAGGVFGSDDGATDGSADSRCSSAGAESADMSLNDRDRAGAS